MSVLDQIEEIITKQLKNEAGDVIWEFSKNFNGRFSYKIKTLNRETMHENVNLFMDKKEIVEWLNKNGWKIYTENKS